MTTEGEAYNDAPALRHVVDPHAVEDDENSDDADDDKDEDEDEDEYESDRDDEGVPATPLGMIHNHCFSLYLILSDKIACMCRRRGSTCQGVREPSTC